MNPAWLLRNASTSWRHRATHRDFVACLLWRYAAKLPKTKPPREWEIGFRYAEPIGDVRLLLRGNRGSDAFVHGEVFFHEYYRLPLSAPPETILDLGANAGLTAVYFGRMYPKARLACVEPVLDNLRVLLRNLELNEIRATVFTAAADVTDGKVRMALDPMDYGHRVTGATNHDVQSTIEVDAMRVPTMLERLGWQRIGLLKIDIEGHERSLLAGDCDWLQRVDAICIECHDGFGAADLTGLANRYGFDPPAELRGLWLMVRRK